ncbi:MAG: hypothetical protein D3920_04385 [Candidatus Electrothrix sp. AW2]|nr:hypothetical protein [Candidatus Electrothrix gigas]
MIFLSFQQDPEPLQRQEKGILGYGSAYPLRGKTIPWVCFNLSAERLNHTSGMLQPLSGAVEPALG